MSTATKKKKRDHVDPVFKEVVEKRFTELGLPLDTEVEVGRLPRKIDIISQLDAQKQEIAKSQTPFIYCLTHNQMAFKGEDDSLTIWDYHLILARMRLYIAKQKVTPSEMTVTIVCAGKPITVLHKSPEHVVFEALGDGYYKADYQVAVYIIAINELPIIKRNYPLLLFASNKRKFRKFLTQYLEEETDYPYLGYAYRTHPQLTREVLKMARLSEIPRENLEFMAQDIGKELMPFLPPEVRLAGLAPQERLAGLAPQERLAGLAPQERLAGLAPQERIAGLALQERLGKLSAKEEEELLDLLLKKRQPQSNGA